MRRRTLSLSQVPPIQPRADAWQKGEIIQVQPKMIAPATDQEDSHFDLASQDRPSGAKPHQQMEASHTLAGCTDQLSNALPSVATLYAALPGPGEAWGKLLDKLAQE